MLQKTRLIGAERSRHAARESSESRVKEQVDTEALSGSYITTYLYSSY